MKKIYFVLAQKNFRDEELFIPLEMLKKEGYTPIILSQKKGNCTGMKGGEITADEAISQARLDDVKAIIVIGGSGSLSLLEEPSLGSLLESAKQQHILIGAICYGPMIVAHFGIIDGMHATVAADKKSLPVFKKHNVMYISQPVVVDEWFVSANGPDWATAFGEEIIHSLEE